MLLVGEWKKHRSTVYLILCNVGDGTLLTGTTRKAPPPPASMITAMNLGLTAQSGLSHVTRDTLTSSMQCSAFHAWAKTWRNLLCLTTPRRKDIPEEIKITQRNSYNSATLNGQMLLNDSKLLTHQLKSKKLLSANSNQISRIIINQTANKLEK